MRPISLQPRGRGGTPRAPRGDPHSANWRVVQVRRTIHDREHILGKCLGCMNGALPASEAPAASPLPFPVCSQAPGKSASGLENRASKSVMATCDFCGASSAALLACARCHLVSYCGKACQSRHWKERGHKERCKGILIMMEAVVQAVKNGDASEMKHLLTVHSTILTNKVIGGKIGTSLACLAAELGQVAILEILRDVKVNLKTADEYGETPAFVAARNGHVAILKLLQGANVNICLPKINGVTPAFIAAQNGHLAILEHLRDAKANLDATNKEDVTPAIIAAQNGHVAVLALLRDAKVNLETSNTNGTTPAIIAAQNGHVDVLALLWDAKVNLETPKKDGSTPALIAAENGQTAVLELLMDAGVNLETPNKKGVTPAHVAVSNGHLTVLKLLRDAKVNLDTQDEAGITPAWTAAANNHVAVLELLRDAKVNLEAPISNGITLAIIAARKGHVTVLELLRDAKVNLETPNKDGVTPAMLAAKYGHVAVLKLLWDLHVDLESLLCHSMTLASFAAEAGHVAVLKFLRDAKVDLSVSANGLTPAHFASQNGHIDALKILLESNAVDLNLIGVSLAQMASDHNQVGVLRFLHGNGVNLALAQDGVTPLARAQRKGHAAAVAFLESAAATSEGSGSYSVSCCAPSDKNECANCSAPEGPAEARLLPCSRCQLVSYCGKACQVQHWKAGGHRQRCVALSDRSAAAAQASCSLSGPEFNSSEKCGICLEPLMAGSTETLGCGHELHVECAAEMKASGAALVCPICRRSLVS